MVGKRSGSQRRAAFALCGVAIALSACAQAQQLAGSVQPGQIVGGATKQMTTVVPGAGFLPDPSLLSPGGPGQLGQVYFAPGLNAAAYNSVLLDPVAVLAEPGSPLANTPLEQRQALANTFYSDLYTALSTQCHVVSQPSPSTVRLRFALADATVPNAAVNTVATYTPYLSTAYSLASFTLNKGVGYFAGTATAEGYATNASTGALLWQGVDRRGGTTALVENTLNTWLDVHHAFQAWSNVLVTRLQQMGVCGA
jgi:hypothetical protein